MRTIGMMLLAASAAASFICNKSNIDAESNGPNTAHVRYNTTINAALTCTAFHDQITRTLAPCSWHALMYVCMYVCVPLHVLYTQ